MSKQQWTEEVQRSVATRAAIARWKAEGVAPMPELRALQPISRQRARELGLPPMGADEEDELLGGVWTEAKRRERGIDD